MDSKKNNQEIQQHPLEFDPCYMLAPFDHYVTDLPLPALAIPGIYYDNIPTIDGYEFQYIYVEVYWDDKLIEEDADQNELVLILEDVPEEKRTRGICLCLYDLPVNTECLRIEMYAHYINHKKRKNPYKNILLYDSRRLLYRDYFCFEKMKKEPGSFSEYQELTEKIINVREHPDVIVYTHDHREWETDEYGKILEKEDALFAPYMDSGAITVHQYYLPGLFYRFMFDLKALSPFTLEKTYHGSKLTFELKE